jgi:hypothetical protein
MPTVVYGKSWTSDPVKRDDRGNRSLSLRPAIEDAIRLTEAHRYAVINPQIDRFKADHPDWAQHFDMMEHQSKHTTKAPFHSPEDVYTDLCHALDRAKG